MGTEESLFGKRCGNLLGDKRVGLITKLLNQLVSRSRDKNIVLDRDILIIQLVNET